METVFFKGQACHTCGTVPSVGETAPCFHLSGPDLSQLLCTDFTGKRVVLNIFPSLDTEVCAMSVRRFNEEAAKLDDVVVIGYGAVKERDLVGAVDHVDSRVIEDRSTGTLARALQGENVGTLVYEG